MRYLKRTILSLVITIGIIIHGYSQSSMNIHFGPSIPISNFSYGEITLPTSPYIVTATPKVGITVGLKNIHKLPNRNIGFFMELDFIYNAPNNKYRDSVTNYNPFSSRDYPWNNYQIVQIQKYCNLPITLGLDYQYSIAENLLLDFDVGVSMNFMKLSDFVYRLSPRKTYRHKTDWSINQGFKMGMGVILNERYSFNLNYFGLGKHKIIERIRSGHWYYLPQLNIHFLTISTGICF